MKKLQLLALTMLLSTPVAITYTSAEDAVSAVAADEAGERTKFVRFQDAVDQAEDNCDAADNALIDAQSNTIDALSKRLQDNPKKGIFTKEQRARLLKMSQSELEEKISNITSKIEKIKDRQKELRVLQDEADRNNQHEVAQMFQNRQNKKGEKLIELYKKIDKVKKILAKIEANNK